MGFSLSNIMEMILFIRNLNQFGIASSFIKVMKWFNSV